MPTLPFLLHRCTRQLHGVGIHQSRSLSRRHSFQWVLPHTPVNNIHRIYHQLSHSTSSFQVDNLDQPVPPTISLHLQLPTWTNQFQLGFFLRQFSGMSGQFLKEQDVHGYCWVMPALSPSKAICISKLLYTGLCRTGVYYTTKVQFCHNFPLKIGVRIIQVCALYSNFYGNRHIQWQQTAHWGKGCCLWLPFAFFACHHTLGHSVPATLPDTLSLTKT